CRHFLRQQESERSGVAVGAQLDTEENFVMLKQRHIKEQGRICNQRAILDIGDDADDFERRPARPAVGGHRDALSEGIGWRPKALSQLFAKDTDKWSPSRVLRPAIAARQKRNIERTEVTG